MPALVALWERCTAAGAVADTEHRKYWFVAAAEHARRCGKRNPPGLFASMLRDPDLFAGFITVGDQESATRRIHEYRGAAT
jgi:hypothetical protein